MSKSKILVIGSTGNVGSEIVRLLKKDGHVVLGTTSKKENTHNEQVYINLATGEGLRAAFDGIDRAFIFAPPGFADHTKILFPLIDEAKKHSLKKVVLMSAMGAEAVETSPLRQSEIRLEQSGIPYNIIRPNWFMQNFNTFWIQGIKQFNKILLPVGDSKTSFIDTRDISAVAAKLLVDDSYNGRAFNLTGAEALDHHQVAKAISEVTGKNITFQDIPAEEMKKGLLSAGLPEDYADFLLMILGAVKAGYSAGITNNVKNILGREPLKLQDYVKDFKLSWS